MKTAWWHSRPVRKALTQPLWWWNRHRPWPIRERVFGLPSHPMAGEAGTRLVVLATPASVTDAAWTARSFLHRLDRAPAGRLALDLYLDSPDPDLLAQTTDRWTRLFPGSEVYATWEAVDKITPLAPTLAELAKSYPLGRKLSVLLHAQERNDVIYTDSDVLLLHDTPEFAQAMRDGGPALYNQEAGAICADQRLLDYARWHGWPAHADRLNSGLLFLPHGCLPIETAERILSLGAHDPDSYFIEQTVVALLMGAGGARPLPPERYLVSPRGQFYGERDADYRQLTARHFTTPVRHLMYARGMPLLWRQWHEKSP